MTCMGLWFGGLASSAFLYGSVLGMWMYPPITWVALGDNEPAAMCRLHKKDADDIAKPV